MAHPSQTTKQRLWAATCSYFENFTTRETTKQTDATDDSTLTSSENDRITPPNLSTSCEFVPDKSSRARIDEQVPLQSSLAASELEKQAKLSYSAQAVDMASRVFWWCPSLPSRATSSLMNKCKDFAVNMVVQQAAKKGVGILGTTAPDTPLQRLKECLFELYQKVSKKFDIDDPLRERTIAALDEFLPNHKEWLADCYSPNAWVYPEALYRAHHKLKILSKCSEGRKQPS